MKVFIIGNGFDKGHDLKTNYWDFRIYLKNMYPEFLNAFEGHYYIYPANNDVYCTIKIPTIAEGNPKSCMRIFPTIADAFGISLKPQ